MTKKTYPCGKCAGDGTIRAFSHVLGGVCFKCGGTGRQKSKPASPGRNYAVYAIDRVTFQEIHVYNGKLRRGEGWVEALKKARIQFLESRGYLPETARIVFVD